MEKITAEQAAQLQHELYERLAPSFLYETRPETAIPWNELSGPNKQLMIAVFEELLPMLARSESTSMLDLPGGDGETPDTCSSKGTLEKRMEGP